MFDFKTVINPKKTKKHRLSITYQAATQTLCSKLNNPQRMMPDDLLTRSNFKSNIHCGIVFLYFVMLIHISSAEKHIQGAQYSGELKGVSASNLLIYSASCLSLYSANNSSLLIVLVRLTACCNAVSACSPNK